ncbi:MAG: 50S ribosome-binding GTPase, partial [Candidatus Omnitrophica bacterium]|nr:50S ribosome-binding GTPase [Candidatus Omnitrophota bacterium]
MGSENSAPPLIAIVGRPNVGKSTLFNRLVGRRRAIVEPACGVTRDRVYESFFSGRHAFRLVDTGGLIPGSREKIPAAIRAQADKAIAEAQVIFFVVDAKCGVHPDDVEILAAVRRAGKRIFLIVNKVDSPAQETMHAEFHALGISDVFCISAEHGLNIEAMLSLLEKEVAVPAPPVVPREASLCRIAIVGRPNV